MGIKAEARNWWISTLLGQGAAAHPVFGRDVQVDVDGDVVTLTGSVETEEERQEFEREAYAIDIVRDVVNRVAVSGSPAPYHRQTVLAIFADEDAARLAQQAASSWTYHDDEPAAVFCRREEAQQHLIEQALAADLSPEDVQSYLAALDGGKVLLGDSVPEDDALRIVSALEGTRAESIRTLPPEPAAIEDR